MAPYLFYLPPPDDLLKADGLGPGERWITVRPNGEGSKGHPILIREHPDGTATVIGGAGGSLTGLRIRPRKAGETDTEAIRRRQEERKAARAAKIAADKESGVHEAKQEAKKAVKAERVKAEREFVQTVAKAAGWDPAMLEPPAEALEGLSEAEQERVRRQHHRDLLSAANQAARLALDRVKLDHERRAEDVGELPLVSDDHDQISVADLDPVKPGASGLGFSQDFKKRAEDAGLDQAALDAEVAEFKLQAAVAKTGDQHKAEVAADPVKALVKHADAVREKPLVDPKAAAKQADMKSSVEILKARKKLQLLARQAKDASKEIDASRVVEAKAYSLVAADDAEVEAAVRKEVEDDIRTAAARSFLSRVDSEDRASLDRHVGVGAFNAINNVAVTVTGQAAMDRSVVDVLGVSGAAQVMARSLRASLGAEDFERVRGALEDYHRAAYAKQTQEALKQADDWHKVASSIELPETCKTADDFEHAQSLNAKRRDAVAESKRVLGTVLGETEANAAMIAAMREPPADSLAVPMGRLSMEAAVVQARALGLKKGDYSLEQVGGETVLTVHGSGLDALARPVDKEDLAQIRRSQAIIRGEHDEEGWLPLGFARRPDLGVAAPATAERLARPFEPGEDLQQSLRDYIGGRMADGDAPADILADVQSADFIQKSGGDAKAYGQALGAVVPLKDEAGKLRRAEDFAPIFDGYADDFVQREYGGTRSTLNKQTVKADDKTVEALHRALSAHPDGVLAFKPVGDLTARDQGALRNWFAKNVAREGDGEAQLRADLEAHEGNEPERETTDMFGDTVPNPAWSEWKSRHDELSQKLDQASLGWQKYVKAMGGTVRAYEALQDQIKSGVMQKFAEAHNSLRPDAPLKVGLRTIKHNLRHLDAVDPKAREERAAKEAALRDSLRERVQGKYAAGSVIEKLDAYKEQKAAFEQAQMGFFSSEDAPVAKDRPLSADERHTIGHAAEAEVAKLMQVVGPNFKPGEPVKLWNPSMSGKYAPQQRAIKMLVANKRLGGALGAGSGKTAIMLGGFSHLHGMGKAKRGIMLVPSIVQGQFAGEALRYLEPGKFNWHIEPGASRDERIAAYKNPERHFCVMTHQSFRDDMVHLGAKHAGIDEGEMVKRLAGMSPDQRRDWIRGVMETEGINFDVSFVDEAHATVNRAGKADSVLSNVTEALGDHTPYYGYFSGDPIKNDASEIHSVLSKLDRKRYGDRGAFMRKYGVDTMAAKEGLRREMSRYVFPNRISSGVNAERKQEVVQLSGGQKQALAELNKHFANARLARMRGDVDLEAMRAISPSSFEGVPEDKHRDLAEDLQKSLGIMKSSAIKRVINSHPENAKVDRLVHLVNERKGKQGVVFAKNRADITAIKARLESQGHRVVTITGSDSAQEKDRKRKMFNPEAGDPEADIMLASDAGAVGMNLQSGRYLIQHDVPDTALVHGQRNARIDRLGQKNDVELIDLIADHPEEFRARDRLLKKYELRELMTSPMEGLDDTGFAWHLAQRQHAAPEV